MQQDISVEIQWLGNNRRVRKEKFRAVLRSLETPKGLVIIKNNHIRNEDCTYKDLLDNRPRI